LVEGSVEPEDSAKSSMSHTKSPSVFVNYEGNIRKEQFGAYLERAPQGKRFEEKQQEMSFRIGDNLFE
jgi:hypothetical protein